MLLPRPIIAFAGACGAGHFPMSPLPGALAGRSPQPAMEAGGAYKPGEDHPKHLLCPGVPSNVSNFPSGAGRASVSIYNGSGQVRNVIR